jgi:methionyl-tRNA formyltransferase
MTAKPTIIFYGTPEFAVPSLEILYQNNFPLAAVVTSPDKPAGRGQKITMSPVKEFALSKGLKILQPENLKDDRFISELRELKPDLQVVVAFRKLPEEVWSLPPAGTINLHASLLPQYRGAAPINWAIINGEKNTGLTTFFINKDIDKGNVIFKEQTMIGEHESAGELHDRLKITGAGLLLKTVTAIAENNVYTYDQEALREGMTLLSAPKLDKNNTKIDVRYRPEQMCNFIFGLNPYPGAHTMLVNNNGISFSVKLFNARPHVLSHRHAAGKIETDGKSFLNIFLPGGYISVSELQLSGKSRMNIKDFLNGHKIEGDWCIK